jgi:Ala-tRNA(Pro) deacylase
MALLKKIQEYLEKEKIAYKASCHPTAYTALEVAGVEHIPGKQMVKSVIIKSGDNSYLMCVMPAIHLVDFEKLRKVSKMDNLRLAEEEEIANIFPDYEIGAEPPFGHLHGLKVFADKILEEDDEIAFNAGTHTDIVRIKFKDFKRVVNPLIADIGTHI